MRIYVEGEEIHYPEDAGEEWFSAFIKGLVRSRGADVSFEIIVAAETPYLDDSYVLEMWVPKAPPLRAQEIGGILKECRPSKDGG